MGWLFDLFFKPLGEYKEPFILDMSESIKILDDIKESVDKVNEFGLTDNETDMFNSMEVTGLYTDNDKNGINK